MTLAGPFVALLVLGNIISAIAAWRSWRHARSTGRSIEATAAAAARVDAARKQIDQIRDKNEHRVDDRLRLLESHSQFIGHPTRQTSAPPCVES